MLAGLEFSRLKTKRIVGCSLLLYVFLDAHLVFIIGQSRPKRKNKNIVFFARFACRIG